MTPGPTADDRRRFERARADLADAARKSEDARVALFAARESVRRAERARRPPGDRARTVTERGVAAQEARASLRERRQAFEPFTDPRIASPLLDDATPILLFPLRLETRFGSTMRDGLAQPQLWVRVYPDDCLVDSFEPLPSETEIASAQRYWTSMWTARGIEGRQRAAWRSLVASHGSGRAGWLEANYKPLNIGTRPNDSTANALVLAIPTEAPLVDPEAASVVALWRAVWLAGDDRAGVQQAMTDFRAAIADDARAQALIDGYTPANLKDEPPPGVARAAVQLSVRFVEFPPTASLSAALGSWSQPARANTLPERLVLLAYVNGQKVLDELGSVIPWPLVVGPDPLAAPDDQIRQEDGEIKVGDDLRWLTDFDSAVIIGMGFRVDLPPALAASGFDQLFVVGLRVSADAQEGRRLLEELLSHHRDGSSGFAILKQGTPTNNTEDESSGFTRSEEADRTFDERLHPGAPLRTDAPWNERLDGEWLADALGIDPALLATVGGSRNTDQLEAQAMNVALWPATLGYSLETMMHPIFDGGDVDRVRWFYEHFVTGRGQIPAIRLGRQPYGVLPATAFSRLVWPHDRELRPVAGTAAPAGFRTMLSRLDQLLRVMAGDWAGLVQKVSRVGGAGDPHQVLLDILGLHAASVEHYQRFAESLDDIYNRARFYEWGERFNELLQAIQYEAIGQAQLEHFGYTGPTPDILNRLFLDAPNLLTGPFIDDVPLSESSTLQTVTAEGWNYIEWMRQAATTSLDTLRKESGFTGNKVPRALLYLLLRHSLLQTYWDSGLRLGEARGVLDGAAVKAARQEKPFIHVQHDGHGQESRWQMLYTQDSALTGDPQVRVADYLTGAVGAEPATVHLARIVGALDVLRRVSTSRLERLFAEHLDTCAYRLDAWQQGFAQYAVAQARYRTENGTPVTRRGVLLGAFGWLEPVRPRRRQLDPVQPAPGLDASFFTAPPPGPDPDHPAPVLSQEELLHMAMMAMPGMDMPMARMMDTGAPASHAPGMTAPGMDTTGTDMPGMNMPGMVAHVPTAPAGPIVAVAPPPPFPPLLHDSTNGGYIHAPSLNQAVAAAVLRNGYLANASPANPGVFAVNLSSERVRLALSFLEGVRQGQSLGALLGYQLERALHDRWALGEIDEHIYGLRKKFPLVADRDPDTRSDSSDPIETIEARNVVDGLRLVEYVKTHAVRTYPFGFTDLPSGAGGKGAAIDREVERLIDTIDAIADVNVADSVYHAVLSNYDGVAATLQAAGQGQMPPQPAVIDTPRSGRTVTHRVALHLEPGLDEDVSPIAGLGVTPRARLEPALNSWLASMLPAPDTVACTVRWFDIGTNALATQTVTQEDLGLQPIDLLYAAVAADGDQAMGELDDRILLFAHETFVSRPDCQVTILYRPAIPGAVTFLEVAPLVRALRKVLMTSRPLRPTDEIVQGAASTSMDAAVRVEPARITKVQAALTALRDDLIAFRDPLAALHAATPIDEAQVRAGLDQRLTDFAALLGRAASFGLGDSGWGFVLDFRNRWFTSALELVRARTERFAARLADCDARLAAYDAGEAAMTEPERLLALDKAERMVRVASTMRTQANAAAYRLAVGTARTRFASRLTALRAILALETRRITTLRTAVLAAVDGPPPLGELDAEPMELADLDAALITASADLLARAKRLVKLIDDTRLTPAASLIAKYGTSADSAARARLLGEAAKKLCGDDAILIPEFTLADDPGVAMQAAYDAGVAGEPIAWQRAVMKTPVPVDTWLYGVARVRDKMQAWEQSIMLEEAFGSIAPELTAMQIPWKAGEHWLALQYPTSFAPDGERLCLTAHFVVPFDRTDPQCGLLIDEWTEVIPANQETTGLTFHFDRPNAEAPQALLLVTPPAFTGAWQWADIVDAVRETLERAKSRAVEPAHLDETAYARFLPMTVMATTLHQISIVTNLARNNDYSTYLKAKDG